LESDFVHYWVLLLVCCDILLLVCRAQIFSQDQESPALLWLAILQTVLLCASAVELVAQISFKTKTHRFTSSKIRWLWWDAFLVLLSMVCLCIFGLSGLVAVLPRLPRVFRVFYSGKYYAWHKPILMLLGTILHSLASLLHGLAVLALTILFFAVIGMEGLQGPVEEVMGPAAVERFGEQTVEDCRYALSSLFSSIST
jgi:hypothetical protein